MDSGERIDPIAEIFDCIQKGENFVLQGGAGSGKTETLKRVLSRISDENPDKKITCITHTNLAAEEIRSRVGEGYTIGTIHSFLYSLIKDYKKNIHSVIAEIFKVPAVKRRQLSEYSDEKEQKKKEHDNYKKIYDKYESTVYRVHKRQVPKVPGKREYDTNPEEFNRTLNNKINELNSEIEKIVEGKSFHDIEYSDSRFDSFENLSFGHDSLISIVALLFQKFPVLSKIVRDKFDFIFIDEYQDTHEDIISVFLNSVAKNDGPIVGLFGDSMQGIYDNGIGDVESYIENGAIKKINKEDNYRCSEQVIDFINTLRNDELEQKVALKKKKNGTIETLAERQGIVKLYYATYEGERTDSGNPKDKDDYLQKLNTLIGSVQEKHPNFKKLFLTNKSIAGEVGFGNLYEIFRVRYTDVKEEIERDLTRLQFIDLAELFDAYNNKKYNEVLVRIKRAGFELKTVEDKNRVSKLFGELVKSNGSAFEILQKAFEIKVLSPSESYNNYVSRKEIFLKVLSEDEEYQIFKTNYLNGGDTLARMLANGIEITSKEFDNKEYDLKKETFFNDLFSNKISFKDIISYHNYLNDKTEYITMHKTKGSSIENVMVVLDEYFWSQYNFRIVFGETSAEDNKKLYNQKLIYVACSRAIKSLVCIRMVAPGEQHSLIESFPESELIRL
jgi:DNA helicase-2/ATP-dependent DNA helicase PcrA